MRLKRPQRKLLGFIEIILCIRVPSVWFFSIRAVAHRRAPRNADCEVSKKSLQILKRSLDGELRQECQELSASHRRATATARLSGGPHGSALGLRTIRFESIGQLRAELEEIGFGILPTLNAIAALIVQAADQ